MTDSNKLNIADLQQAAEALETIAGYLRAYLPGYAPYVERLDIALPMLLEIAAAALARWDALAAIESDMSKDWGPVYAADARIKQALSKVRP